MHPEPDTNDLIEIIIRAKKVAVLTGAGISAESGVPTFRGNEGLWKQYRPEELATPGAFARNPGLVWEWYEWRRGIIAAKETNPGHQVLSEWEKRFPEFTLITQNVDGLHTAAGSKNILELHGNIWKVRCTQEGTVTENFQNPLNPLPPVCPDCGAMQRPHIVWFGESLDPEIIQRAFETSSDCDLMWVIGTSSVVHPAASLPLAALEGGACLVEVNPDPTPLTPHCRFSFRGPAGGILPSIDRTWLEHLTEKE